MTNGQVYTLVFCIIIAAFAAIWFYQRFVDKPAQEDQDGPKHDRVSFEEKRIEWARQSEVFATALRDKIGRTADHIRDNHYIFVCDGMFYHLYKEVQENTPREYGECPAIREIDLIFGPCDDICVPFNDSQPYCGYGEFAEALMKRGMIPGDVSRIRAPGLHLVRNFPNGLKGVKGRLDNLKRLKDQLRAYQLMGKDLKEAKLVEVRENFFSILIKKYEDDSWIDAGLDSPFVFLSSEHSDEISTEAVWPVSSDEITLDKFFHKYGSFLINFPRLVFEYTYTGKEVAGYLKDLVELIKLWAEMRKTYAPVDESDPLEFGLFMPADIYFAERDS